MWSLAPAGGLLRVRQNDKSTAQFHKFSKSNEDALRAALSSKLGKELRTEEVSVQGHNWGHLSVHGSSVAFQVRPPGRAATHLPCPAAPATP
jgi:hypothetical protein